MTPNEGFVAIKADAVSEVTKSGLYITNPSKRQLDGTVVAVGENVNDLKKGDKVSFFTIHAPIENEVYYVSATEEDCKIAFKYN